MTNNDVYWWRSLDDAELDTRGEILFAAYQEIHVNGFQAASLANILGRTGVTKGALYHHFKDKTELGYAVIDEVIAHRIHLTFIQPMNNVDDPIDGFIALIEDAGSQFSMTDIELGCPLTVLSQEMAPIDEGFRTRLTAIYELWHQSIAILLNRAKEDHLIRDDIDPYTMAVTIVAIMEGSLNAVKVSRDMEKLRLCGEGLTQFLQLIRKTGNN